MHQNAISYIVHTEVWQIEEVNILNDIYHFTKDFLLGLFEI